MLFDSPQDCLSPPLPPAIAGRNSRNAFRLAVAWPSAFGLPFDSGIGRPSIGRKAAWPSARGHSASRPPGPGLRLVALVALGAPVASPLPPRRWSLICARRRGAAVMGIGSQQWASAMGRRRKANLPPAAAGRPAFPTLRAPHPSHRGSIMASSAERGARSRGLHPCRRARGCRMDRINPRTETSNPAPPRDPPRLPAPHPHHPGRWARAGVGGSSAHGRSRVGERLACPAHGTAPRPEIGATSTERFLKALLEHSLNPAGAGRVRGRSPEIFGSTPSE